MKESSGAFGRTPFLENEILRVNPVERCASIAQWDSDPAITRRRYHFSLFADIAVFVQRFLLGKRYDFLPSGAGQSALKTAKALSTLKHEGFVKRSSLSLTYPLSGSFFLPGEGPNRLKPFHVHLHVSAWSPVNASHPEKRGCDSH